MNADEAMMLIQKDLNSIKEVFLNNTFNDIAHGWIIEDYLHSIQDTLNDYTNREYKASAPDSFS